MPYNKWQFMPEFTRINKFLAHATGLSRREVDAAVQSGRVTINGIKASLGAHVNNGDTVQLDNKPVHTNTAYTYLLLNKPVGYVCSRRRQGDTPTIYELLPERYRALKPVGRLDKDSSGLLLLSDDGDFAHRMTHPSFHKVKVYEVTLNKSLEPLHQQMISDYGVTLEDGVSRFLVEELDLSSQFLDLRKAQSAPSKNQDLSSKISTRYRVTMHEGRNRQIRRTFAALGYTVIGLYRTHFGTYTLNELTPGTTKLVQP